MPKTKPKSKKGKALTVQMPVINGAITLYSPDIASLLHKKTPKEFIDKHPYNGLDYVQIGYVRRCVEDFCAKLQATWNFETDEPGTCEALLKAKHIVVKGRLTIVMKDGTFMLREQYGGADVKFYKPMHKTRPSMPMDLGNDYKSAASDAFKKCASSFGIAQDVFEPKVEKKLKAMSPARVAEVMGGDVIETSGTDIPKGEKAPEGEPDFTSDERITSDAMTIAAKLLHKSAIKDEATKYMKSSFEHTSMTKLTMGQFNQLITWAGKQEKLDIALF